MGQLAAKKEQPATPAHDEIDEYMESINAKKLFIGTTAGMGWRLAITVLVPILIGVKLDDHFHTSPSYTLTGLILAIAAAVLVVMNTVKEVNQNQADEENERKKTR